MCYLNDCRKRRATFSPFIVLLVFVATSCYYPDPNYDTDSQPGDADAVPGFFAKPPPVPERGAQEPPGASSRPSAENGANPSVAAIPTAATATKPRYSDLLAGKGVECSIRFIERRGDDFELYLVISNNSGRKIDLFAGEALPFVKVDSPRELTLHYGLLPPSAGAQITPASVPPTIELERGEIRELNYRLSLPIKESDNFSAPRLYSGELDVFFDVRAEFGYLFFDPNSRPTMPAYGVLRIAQMTCTTPFVKLHR